ncbi:hexose kinase [Lentibacillus saliphilus]|uniref:hexose kinase n=1 Tax=Lentibacillus saliphilus TaxID=2737028 RepID=UPI001C301788|nr:hexose kinase [Lentibacillus saliphilus]
MILTVTLNPSVDIRYSLDTLHVDAVNRVQDVSKTPGGKGLNVARVLKQLQEDVAATGYLGGELGTYIHTQLTELEIADEFVRIQGDTRNCIAVIHQGNQTEILEGGPNITAEEQTRLLEHFSQIVNATDVVTLSGSLPKGLPDDFYKAMLEISAQAQTPVLLDTNGKLLQATLNSQYQPYLIKPNESELSDLIGQNIESTAEIIEAIRQHSLLAEIPWVVVTLGANGALVKHEESFYHVHIPKIQAVNAVGSGDSVIAGFAAGFSRQLAPVDMMKLGMATGVLNAMEEKTGFINPDKLPTILEQIKVEQIEP